MGILDDITKVVTGPLATIGSGVLGFLGQEDTNKQNVDLGQKQMDFQERMSSTAYQRATADMKAAGLNPMLAYSQGGASSPIGSMPQVQNARAAGANSALMAANTSIAAQQVEQSKAQTDATRAQIAQIAATVDNLQANSAKTRSETLDQAINQARVTAAIDNMKASSGNLREGTRRLGTQQLVDIATASNLNAAHVGILANSDMLERQRNADVANDMFSVDVAKRKAEAQLLANAVPKSSAEGEYFSGVGKYEPYLNTVLSVLGGVSGAAGAARQMARPTIIPRGGRVHE